METGTGGKYRGIAPLLHGYQFANEVIDSPKIGSALKLDPYHNFPSIIDNYAGDAQQFLIPTKDLGGKVVRNSTLYQLEGSYNVNGSMRDGIFEWIVDEGNVTHRRFIEGGVVTGYPNQIPNR